MGIMLYEDLDEAYLVPETMEKLRKANELLRKKRIELHLVVYDAEDRIRLRNRCGKLWRIPNLKTL